MDKKTLTGFALMALVLIGFMYLSKPSQAEMQRQKRYNDSIQTLKQKKATTHQDSVGLAQAAVINKKVDSTELFSTSTKGQEQFTTIENNLMKLVVTNKGGQIYSATLKKYNDQNKQPLELFKGPDEQSFNCFFYDNKENIASADHYFVPVNKTDSSVTMRMYSDSKSYIDFTYKLRQGDYMLDFNIQAIGLENKLSPKTTTIDMIWGQKARQLERSKSFENRYTNIAYKPVADNVESMSDTKDEDITPQSNIKWVGYKNQYFSDVLIAEQNFTKPSLKTRMEDKTSKYLKNYSASMSVTFDPSGKNVTKMRMFIGPNNYKLLKRYDKDNKGQKLELNSLIYLGWPVIRWVNQYFTINLFDILSNWGLSMGIVLLLMTLIVKGIVFPLTYKSYISSSRMRVLKPQIDELTKKYPNKDDAMKKQQETMAMYSKYGVSPMSGCLPMVLQMPVLMALFFFVPSAIELRGQSFLWADDLSAYDNLIHWSSSIPFLGTHLSLFCVLMTIFNILNTKYNMAQQDTGQQQVPGMKWMMYLMPVMFIFVLNDYAAGLNYYYCISSIISIATMIIMRKMITDDSILAQLKQFAADPSNKKKRSSGMMAKLGQMQQEQQRLAEDRAKRNNKK
jgi:YidC/Oxa1 family membrane protein insertase